MITGVIRGRRWSPAKSTPVRESRRQMCAASCPGVWITSRCRPAAESDPVAIGDRLGGRFGWQEVVGDGLHRRQLGNLVGRSAVSGGHGCGFADEPGRVVVAVDQRRDPLVHDQPPTAVGDETGRHADMVDVEMGADEPPDRGVGETEGR